jgi:hypothetical protein
VSACREENKRRGRELAKMSELANGERISGGERIHRESEFAKGSRIMARGKNWGILQRRG